MRMGWNRSNPKITQGTKSTMCLDPTFAVSPQPSSYSPSSDGDFDMWNEKTKVCIRKIYVEVTPSHHYLIFPNLRGHFIVLIVQMRTRGDAVSPGTHPGGETGSVTPANCIWASRR